MSFYFCCYIVVGISKFVVLFLESLIIIFLLRLIFFVIIMVIVVVIIEILILGNNVVIVVVFLERVNFVVKLFIYKYFKLLFIVISLFILVFVWIDW